MEQHKSLEIIRTFTDENLPSLATCTLGALELFIEKGMQDFEFKDFKRPLIIGSGNAIVTGKILFAHKDAIFADENTYKEALKQDCGGVIIFSASGGKHAPIMAQAAIDAQKPTQLVTCTPNSPAQAVVGEEDTVVTQKNREPYTYNTSTYMGWVLTKTKESPQEIYDFILGYVEPVIPNNLSEYNGFLLVTPNHYSRLNQLFEVKFIELFGRQVARDVKTFEELKHAITVVPNEKELCIQFGEGEVDFEGEILKIPLPHEMNKGALMAIAYFVIGRLQEQFPQYYKENIHRYIERNSSEEGFGKVISVIVE